MSTQKKDSPDEFFALDDESTMRPTLELLDGGRLSLEDIGRSAEASANADPLVALLAAWRAVPCRGCGQRPERLQPLDAVAVARLLLRRCASLLHRREDSLQRRRGGSGSWSAIEPAARVAIVLDAADRALRRQLGEEEPGPMASLINEPSPVAGRLVPAAVLGSLAESVRRLTATIAGATAEDWYRRRGGDVTAGQVVWLALHAATHQLEDAELVLDGSVGERPSAWATADGHPN
jgi:hypothetical protein